jgi:glycosyltransferase involved in cell wall biosynthesis
VGSVGRLVRWKGHDVFLAAMARVMEDDPTARAVIVGAEGATPDSVGVENELRALAADLGIADRVVFTGYRADVSDVMAAADVVAHSAVRPEPFGRVVTEAMACARPVVATRGGGVLEIVDDGVTGTLVAMGDPGDMARGILGLLADPARAAAMGRAAREAVRTRFSPEQHLAGVEAAYLAALSRPRRTARVSAVSSVA